MKAIKTLLLLTLSLSLLASCKKKTAEPINTPKPTPRIADYFPLTPGNYWIYKRVWKDTSGNDLSGTPADYDSFYVAKDTIVDFKKYAKVWMVDPSGNGDFLLLRDSSQTVVNVWGYVFIDDLSTPRILSEHYNNFVNPTDTVYLLTTQVDAGQTIVSTPAGSFTTKSITQTYHFAPWRPNIYDPRTYHTYYADSIGLILRESVGYIDAYPPSYTEQRLVRYHVQ